MGDDGFFSVLDDFGNYITGKKKGGFGKYDKVIDRTLEEIPDPYTPPKSQPKQGFKKRMPPARRNFGPIVRKRAAGQMSRRTTYKRKRAPVRRTSMKKRKRKMLKRTTKQRKIVSLTVGTARQRTQTHFTAEANGSSAESVYAGFSNLGPIAKINDMVAQAVLLHYMHRVGDYRASKNMVPASQFASGTSPGSGNQVCTWTSIQFHWASYQASDVSNTVFAIDAFDSTANRFKTLDEMTTELSSMFTTKASTEGFRIGQVIVARDGKAILNDISAGRNIIEFGVKSTLKVQNVTLGDDGDATAAANPMSIRRNPLDGMVYKFKNRIPEYKLQYLMSKIDADKAIVEDLNDQYSTHASGLTVPLLGGVTEFKIPPKTPSVMFKNLSGKSTCRIGPGAHKSFGDYEFYRGAINSYFDRYFGLYRGSTANDFVRVTPPGGSSTLIGLKPTYRNGVTEDIKLDCEIDYFYSARMTKARLTPLPTSAVVDA